jgi:gamma-glutamyltranspeptidase/glutathione hydrolase
MGRQFVAAVASAGGALDIKDLRAYRPVWRPTLKIPYFRNVTIHFPMMPGPSGVLAAQVTGMLIEDNNWDDYSLAERSHLLAELSGRANYARGRWLRSDGSTATSPDNLVSEEAIERLIEGFQNDRHTPMPNARTGPAQALGNNVGTSFVVVDREGSAVACALTLNNPFGVGRVAQGMGIILAALPAPMGRGLDSLGTMLGVNNLHNIFYYGAAGTGSIAVPGVLAGVVLGTVLPGSGENLETAIDAKRVYNSGDPDVTYYERGLAGGVVAALGKLGHRLKPASGMGLVNAIFCPTGVPNKEGMSCAIRTDPRGFGLASGAE